MTRAEPTPPEPADQTVADVSEDELLARIFPLLPRGSSTLLGPGDDAAVVAVPDGRMVVSTDVPAASVAVTHLSVVGGGGSTPHRSTIGLADSPHAVVAWLVVRRRG